MTPQVHAHPAPQIRAAIVLCVLVSFSSLDAHTSRALLSAADDPERRDTAHVAADPPALPLETYTGRDSVTGVPRYVSRPFSGQEQRGLRVHFGIDDPRRLYRSYEGFMVYDSRADRGLYHFVNTYRVGGVSARRPAETIGEFEARIKGRPASYFGPGAREIERRLGALAAAVQGPFQALIDEARRLGLAVTVVETYRSPERQAYLLSRGRGLTFTGTSMHADRRAVDFRVGNGDLTHALTREAYAAFRNLALLRGFGLQGDWDPGHVTLADPAAQPGFHTIEELLAAAANEGNLPHSAIDDQTIAAAKNNERRTVAITEEHFFRVVGAHADYSKPHPTDTSSAAIDVPGARGK